MALRRLRILTCSLCSFFHRGIKTGVGLKKSSNTPWDATDSLKERRRMRRREGRTAGRNSQHTCFIFLWGGGGGSGTLSLRWRRRGVAFPALKAAVLIYSNLTIIITLTVTGRTFSCHWPLASSPGRRFTPLPLNISPPSSLFSFVAHSCVELSSCSSNPPLPFSDFFIVLIKEEIIHAEKIYTILKRNIRVNEHGRLRFSDGYLFMFLFLLSLFLFLLPVICFFSCVILRGWG